MGPGGRGTARLVHVESMDQAADLFTKELYGPMFEEQTNVAVGSKRSKSETMIDGDKRRRLKDGSGSRYPST